MNATFIAPDLKVGVINKTQYQWASAQFNRRIVFVNKVVSKFRSVQLIKLISNFEVSVRTVLKIKIRKIFYLTQYAKIFILSFLLLCMYFKI